jgi:hypothetical protein
MKRGKMSMRNVRALVIGTVVYLVLTVTGVWMTSSMFAHLDAAIAGQTVIRSDLVWLMVDAGLVFPDKDE